MAPNQDRMESSSRLIDDVVVNVGVIDETQEDSAMNEDKSLMDSNPIEEETAVICLLASAAAKTVLKNSMESKTQKRRKVLHRLMCCLRINFKGESLTEDDLDSLRRTSEDKKCIETNPLFIRQESQSSFKTRKMSVSETSDVERALVYETVKSYCLSNILDEMF